jgi:murein DD-endopeptidase MepM/ murein hydrolase activator NlpD
MRLYNPAPGQRVSSGYGPRVHPITGQVGRKHRGIDYAGDNFPILAAGDGIVDATGSNMNKVSGFGHWIRVKHANNLFTVYAHLRARSPLRKGQRVNVGDELGRSGNTGASTGPHLHFETRVTSVWGSDRDPNIYFVNGTPDESGNLPADLPKVPVHGRPDRATWRGWQMELKDNWGYGGIIDGIPGPITYSAIQRYAGVRVDGVLGPVTRRAVQKKIGVPVDGVWGRQTWSEIQRRLNTGCM